MLKKIDILGPQMAFRIKNDSVLKSSIGGLLGLLLVVIFAVAFLLFGRDLFEGKNPQVMMNRVETPETEYQMTYKNYLAAVYDQASDEPFSEYERKFEHTIDYYEWSGTGSRVKTTFYMERCQEEILKLWDGQFKNVRSNYWCLPYGKVFNITGTYGKGKHTSARVSVNYCKNNTDLKKGPLKTSCYSREEVAASIPGRIQMHYMMQNSKIDTLNYDTPGGDVTYGGVSNTSPDTWNRLYTYFANTLVETDAGFFVENWVKQLYNGVNTVNSFSVYSKGTGTIFSHIYGNQSFMYVYKRIYIKIQNIFALMGGFISFSLIIMRFAIKYLTQPEFVNIFNKIYHISNVKKNPDDEDDKSSRHLPKTSIIPNNTQLTSNNNRGGPSTFNNFVATTNPRFSKIDDIRKKQKKTDYSVHLTKCTILCRCLEPISDDMKKNLKYYRIVETKMKKVLSAENYIKMSRNVKFFNELFLEDYQKTILSISEHSKKYGGMREEEAFTVIRKKVEESTTNIDKKILQIYTKEVGDF